MANKNKAIKLVKEGEKLIELAKYKQAEKLLLEAIDYDPKNVEIYYLLGEVLCKQERFQDAIMALKIANKLMPHHPRINHLLGWALFMNGNIENGRKYMQQALLDLPDDIQIICDLAVLENQAESSNEALKYIKKALKIAPEDPMVQEVYQVINMIIRMKSMAKEFKKEPN